jgi:hypothetical protein
MESMVTVNKRLMRSRLLSVAPVLLVLLAVLGLLACDTGTGTPTQPAIANSVIGVSVDPSPIVGSQNAVTKAVTAKFKVDITEQNGLGCDVTFISVAVFDPTSGAQLSLVYFDGADLVVFVGSKRIDAKGTLAVPETLNYVLADGSTAANVAIAVQVKDDRGNLVNRSVMAKIQ